MGGGGGGEVVGGGVGGSWEGGRWCLALVWEGDGGLRLVSCMESRQFAVKCVYYNIVP